METVNYTFAVDAPEWFVNLEPRNIFVVDSKMFMKVTDSQVTPISFDHRGLATYGRECFDPARLKDCALEQVLTWEEAATTYTENSPAFSPSRTLLQWVSNFITHE